MNRIRLEVGSFLECKETGGIFKIIHLVWCPGNAELSMSSYTMATLEPIAMTSEWLVKVNLDAVEMFYKVLDDQ